MGNSIRRNHWSYHLTNDLVLARPRTCPQHTPLLLPLLRSRPGGVHKASVVRSPGSDKTFSIADCRFLIVRYALACRLLPNKTSWDDYELGRLRQAKKHIGHSAIKNRQSAMS